MVAINFAPAPTQPGGITDPNEVIRRQELARVLQQRSAGIQDIESPWQGLAQISDAVFGGINANRATTEAANNNKFLAEALGPAMQGNLPPEKLEQIMALNPELGMKLMERQQAETKAAEAKAQEDAQKAQVSAALREMGATREADAFDAGIIPAAKAYEILIAGEKPADRPASMEELDAINAQREAAGLPPYRLDEWQIEKAHASKPDFNVNQGAAASYADRMAAANDVLNNPDLATVQTDLVQKTLGGIPAVGNMMVSSEYQQAEQAQRDFINANLRRESGAVISDDEFDNARKQYFPQPGDGPEVLAQKKANRELAIQGVQRAAGSNYVPPTTQTKPAGAAPSAGAVEDGYRFKGGDPADSANWEPVQ